MAFTSSLCKSKPCHDVAAFHPLPPMCHDSFHATDPLSQSLLPAFLLCVTFHAAELVHVCAAAETPHGLRVSRRLCASDRTA